jgi:polysaccharide export outer membrane protein
MKSRHLLSPALLFLATACAGLADAQAPSPAPPAKAALVEQNGVSGVEEYRIGPEDILQISVWKNDSMSRTVTVRPDGMVSLPLLNDVQAAGLTPAELRGALIKRLTEYMPDPDVSVIVQDVRFFKVSVIGEVAKPGRFELKSRATVLDVLAQAGGFKDFASRSRIVILRTEGPAMKRIPFNYNKAISDGQTETFYLRPGDIVVVP